VTKKGILCETGNKPHISNESKEMKQQNISQARIPSISVGCSWVFLGFSHVTCKALATAHNNPGHVRNHQSGTPINGTKQEGALSKIIANNTHNLKVSGN
jgi:hypothetical protein